MKWGELLTLIGDEPVFRSALLNAGSVSQAQIRLQLTRWTKSGRMVQLRRGVYVLAAPYRKVEPHPFVLANVLERASYVSLQSALAYHGVIPEYVPRVTSVTTGRSETFDTPLGLFEYRHVKKELFFGYTTREVSAGQRAFVARPEKALMDLIYLTPGGDAAAYLEELRLQNLEWFEWKDLERIADRIGKPKLLRAIARFDRIRQGEVFQEL